jgi:hypothetical protein
MNTVPVAYDMVGVEANFHASVGLGVVVNFNLFCNRSCITIVHFVVSAQLNVSVVYGNLGYVRLG